MSGMTRLPTIMRALKRHGVGYRENFGGPFERRFPHSSHTFRIEIDRDGTRIVMFNGATEEEDVELTFQSCHHRFEGDLHAELVEALRVAEKVVRPRVDGPMYEQREKQREETER